jgi:1-pyrroline-5-carboxylate dehydrogenase
VDKKVAANFTELLLAKTKAIKIGDPSEKDVFFGPIINAKAVKTFEAAVESAKKGGKILTGGTRLDQGKLDKGHFVAPTIAELPLSHELFSRELFVPFLSLGVVSGLEEALRESNKVEFGLTAGIFSGKKDEIERFFDEVEAGVCYANRRTGATTGAWPGVQSFCGWKGSGSTGKGGCGPYYLAQFMREQSRTIME